MAKFKVNELDGQLFVKEDEISRLKKTLKNQEEAKCLASVGQEHYKIKFESLSMDNQNLLKENLDLKENIKEKSRRIDQLLLGRKTEGTALLELQHLKADNRRLLNMLKCTQEYQDLADSIDDGNGSVSINAGQISQKVQKRIGCEKCQQTITNDEEWIPVDVI